MSNDAAAFVSPISASIMKKGKHILINGRPCKIIELSKSKPGKHGHAKYNILGVDVLTGKKLQDLQPAHAQIYAVDVKKTIYNLLDIISVSNESISLDLLDNNGLNVQIDVPTSYEHFQELRDSFEKGSCVEVVILTAPFSLVEGLYETSEIIEKHNIVSEN